MIEDVGLTQFRVERTETGVVHLIFDTPGRSMNVFSNAAIRDLGVFAAWLGRSDAQGAVILSAKSSAFCAGADLMELGQAYDLIMAAEPAARFKVAFDHFFQFSQAIRALETCGKPVATAIAGLALGAGCELAMGTHYRVLADSPRAALGLPESLVGLLPGGGGTQRMPRLIGVEQALPVLLAGGRLSGQEAVSAGLVGEIVPPGEEVAAAERWILSRPEARQPWDRPGWRVPDIDRLSGVIAAARTKILHETLGLYPAPLAILACLERGLPLGFDEAIRSEMEIFSGLIQRPEPRDMIRTMFVARTEYERRVKAGDMPAAVTRAMRELPALWNNRDAEVTAALAAAGFGVAGSAKPPVDTAFDGAGYWFDAEPADARKRSVRGVLDEIVRAAAAFADELGADGQRLADYGLVTEAGFPAYLGGPFSVLSHSASA